jgi:hypothetical protein
VEKAAQKRPAFSLDASYRRRVEEQERFRRVYLKPKQ